MKKEQEKTTAYIDRDDWLKFLKELRRLLEKKMLANPDSECIIIERDELDLFWPEIQEGHHRYFAKPETVATILDAALDFSVVADYQNGEKLKFYESKKGHYAILKEYRKRQRLLVILFVIAAIFTCLSATLMIFNFANIITATLLVFLDLLLINVIDKNELKLKELRKIEKAIKMIQ